MRGKPWRISVVDWKPATKRIQELTSSAYDLVWFGSLDSWLELNHLVGSAKVIVDVDDIETEKISSFLTTPVQRTSRNGADRIQARVERLMWARIQESVVRRADAITVCSAVDAEILSAQNVVVVPNCFPDPEYVPTVQPDPTSIVLVGNCGYEPNMDGARFMAREVVPLIRNQFPDVQLQLVGRGAPDALEELARLPGVNAVGEVESTAKCLQRSTLAVAPIRFGGGTRIKIIEAFASARPTVSTALGRHGLEGVDGRELLIADGAEEFAAACCRILQDPGLAASLGAAGRRTYEEFYEPEAVITAIRKIATGLLGS